MRKIVKILCMAMLMVFGVQVQTIQAFATEVEERAPYIVLDGYELSNESIIPGEEFTLTLQLRNPSATVTAHDVLVDITNPNGFSPIYGTVSQTFLGDMEPGAEVEVSFEYEADDNMFSDKVDFSVTILSAGNTNYVTLRTPVGTDKPLTVAAMTIPSVVYVGETSSALLDFRVVGSTSVGNVFVRLECDGEVVGSSQSGTIIAGSTKTQSVSFTLNEIGEKEIGIYLEYFDEKGDAKTDFIGTQIIDVNEKIVDDVSGNGVAVAEINTDNYLKLGMIGFCVILLCFGVVFVCRRKK